MLKTLSRIAAAAASALLAAASAQAFPDKPITLIVPFGAGTSVDANGRDLGQALNALGKVTAVVDNRAGAEGTIGAMAVLNAPADGHTLMVTSSSIPVLDPLVRKGMQFDPVKDFTPICAMSRTSNVINITGSNPIKNAAELIAADKANPGKLTFAYSSATTRLAGELFAQASGIKLTAVPYKASAAGLTDMASGVVDLFFIDHVSVGPLLQSNKARALAVSGDKRVGSLPNVPNAREIGVPGYNIQPWFGVYVSSKTPPAVVAQVRDLVMQALNTPTTKATLERRGQDPILVCGDAMAKFQAEEIELWRGVLKKAGIEPQ
ncbi:MAG: tripartite tricarboxylate transporter substrate binding protein [Ramlibacter sp.]|uniref:Bug family tripartite tricarboxylate transporter substrate binding protein n=1 Tax=Ramlibacter sp. TaxID=1917967 RepID=UPI00261090EE|nr:tripartite tricarboxylate transporter substrate binding protein [Ramlibacter sp.]MDH4376538.1 tripartite tricarboxylate transporter substrate binding protein [Ramlibacter sp.]